MILRMSIKSIVTFNCYIQLNDIIKYNHTKFKFKTNQTLIWKTIFLIKTKKKTFFNNNRNI